MHKPSMSRNHFQLPRAPAYISGTLWGRGRGRVELAACYFGQKGTNKWPAADVMGVAREILKLITQ